MANTYISRAATGSVTSDKTFTFSHWIKRAGGLGSTQYFFMHENASSHAQKLGFDFTTANKIRMSWWDGSNEYNLDTKRLFRDTSGWYNFVFRFDSTQSTASDRVRFYVNGQLEEITNANGSSPTYPGQNATMNLGQKIMAHGRYQASSPGSYFDGSLSHIHYCDGQSYAPTVFGETDSTTGEWKIKTNVTATYGNNGYFILKDGNSVTNQAGNSSGNFSVGGGTLTKTEDNPSNVFATLNPLHIQGTTSRSITYGNTRFYTTTTAWGSALSTLGFSSGKFYVEGKILTLNSSTGYGSIAIQDINAFGSSGNTDANLKGNNASAGLGLDYRSGQSNIQSGGSTVSSNVGDFSNNDIIGMAIDMDNKALYIHKNGTYYQIGGVTGVPTSGASKTGAITIPTSVETCAIGLGSYTSNADFCYNFGNGYFLSTAVSSAGTNASGNGIFEYDVPTGYTALSTKGLNL